MKIQKGTGIMGVVLLTGMLACSGGAKAADVPTLEDLRQQRAQAVEKMQQLADQVKLMDGAIYILQLQEDAVKKPDTKKVEKKK